MPRMIDADKAIEYLENHKRVAEENNFMLAADEDAIIKFISEKCPTIDPESLIPHGRWEEYIEFSDGQIGSYCSECHHGATYFPQRPDRYCRGCGAKMDKEGPDAG